MSLVIKKFAEGGNPDVRLYKRLNDEIDFDAFIRLAELGFNDWLSKADVSEKYKKLLLNAYGDLISKIIENPESFTYKVDSKGPGFSNTVGISNELDGKFPAYGYAANYLGETLRHMPTYTKPKTNKAKYKKDSAFIDSNMLRSIWGDNPNSFIHLDDDSYDLSSGTRGLTHRKAQTIAGLESLKSRLRDYRDFDSDEDYLHGINRIDNVISILKNDNPNDDWFALELLGLTDVDKFFLTGSEKRTEPLSKEEREEATSQNRSLQFEQWVSNAYPRYTGTLHGAINLSSSNDRPVSNAALTEFIDKFKSFSNDDLKKWIKEYISNIDSYDINNNLYMRRIYSYGIPNFNTGQIIATILNRMRENGMLRLFSSDSTKYYIPGTSRQGAGYVWDANPEVNALYHVDIHDIPYWQLRISNEFNLNYPQSGSYTVDPYWSLKYPGMYKKGGILKAKHGVPMTLPLIELLDPIADWNKQLNLQMYNAMASLNWARLNYGTDPNNLDSNGNARVWRANEVLPGWEGSNHSRRTDNIGKEPQTPNIANAYKLLRNYINSGNITSDVRVAYNKWRLENPNASYQDFVDLYNNKVQNVRDLGVTRFEKGYNSKGFLDLYDNYNWLYSSSAATFDPSKGLIGSESTLSDINGSSMFERNALAFNGDDDSADLRLGTFIDNDPTGTLFWINNEGKLELRSNEQSKTDPSTGNPEDKSRLNEEYLRMKNLSSNNSNLPKLNLWDNLGGNLLGAGRLAGSIWANNRIASIVRDSLRPKLHDTYELLSPVTGAFGEMQLRDRLGADVLFQLNKAFTSDASLAAARMLEGLRSANDLQYQGFIADDKEIKRTLAEALKRLEDNIARRSALENENRDAIIANNLALALLEASRIKLNWGSGDNYLKGVESRVLADLDYNKLLKRSLDYDNYIDERKFLLNQIVKQNANTYLPELDKIDKLIAAWEKNNPTKQAERLSWYLDVLDRKAEIADRLREDNQYSVAKFRGWTLPTRTYNTPGKYYDPAQYDWNTIIAKSGGTLKLKSDQLIDKIIRQNEGNS